MKKILSLLLVLTVSAGFLGFSTVSFAANDQIYMDTIYFQEDFTGKVGPNQGSYTTAYGSIGAASNFSVNDGYATFGNPSRFVIDFSQSTADMIATEFDFMLPTSTTSIGQLFGLAHNSGSRAWFMISDGGNVRAPSVPSIVRVQGNEWYSIKVLYNQRTGDTKYYLNGDLVTSINYGAFVNRVNRLDINPAGIMSIDNIKIYSYISGEMLESEITKAQNAISYSSTVTPPIYTYTESAVDEMNTAIAAAQAALLNATTSNEINAATLALKAARLKFINQAEQNPAPVPVFESNFPTSGAIPDPWFEAAGSVIMTSDPLGVKTEGVALSAAGGSRLITQKPSVLTGNTYIATTSFMQRVKGSADQIFNMYAASYDGINEVFNIYTNGSSLILRYGTDAQSSNMTTVYIVEDYAVDTWYDFKTVIDFSTRSFILYVNREPKLVDKTLYFAGSAAANTGNVRLSSRTYSDTYLTGITLYNNDEISRVIDAFDQISQSMQSSYTKYTDVRPLIATANGYDVTWSGTGVSVVNDPREGLCAYSIFPEENDITAELTATIQIGSYSGSLTFSFPVGAFNSGSVLDEDFNHPDGTTLSAIDSNYLDIVGAIPVVTNNVVPLTNQRFLYSVPTENRTAGISVVDFDFMQTQKSAIEHILMVTDSDGTAASAFVRSDGEDIQLFINEEYLDLNNFPNAMPGVDNCIPLLVDYQAGVWYNIKAILNFYTGTYKILINNQVTLDNINVTMATPERNVARLSFNATDSQFQIDNLKLYTMPNNSANVHFYDNQTEITGISQITNNVIRAAILNPNDLCVAIAVYQNGKLYDIHISNLSEEITNIAVPVNKSGVSVKSMTWNSLNGLKPISSATIIQ